MSSSDKAKTIGPGCIDLARAEYEQAGLYVRHYSNLRFAILPLTAFILAGCAPEHTPGPDRPTVPATPDAATAEALSHAHSKEVEALAIEGVTVYRRLIQRYEHTGIYLVGGVDISGGDNPPPPALELALPADAWETMTDQDRVALSYFIESQISVVRLHPAIYALDPLSPPVEKSFRQICDTCWSVKLGTYALSKGGVIDADRTVLAGDERGSRTIFGQPEIMASELRRRVLKHSAGALTWPIERLDPTRRFRIEGEATSPFDARSGLYIHQTPADSAGAWRTN